MKTVILTLSLLLVTSLASAQAKVKLYGGMNFLPDSDFDSSDFPEAEASFDPGFSAGLAAGYQLSDNFTAELEYAYRSNDIDKLGSVSIGEADLASVSVMANLYYNFSEVSEFVTPYIGLGLGFAQEVDADIKFTNSDVDASDLEDSGIAWQIMAGADYKLNENWSVFGEGRFYSAPGPEVSNDVGSYDIDYENFSLNLGIGYRF